MIGVINGLINEVCEVKNYLSGRPVSGRGTYRAVYQLARWYTQEGLSFQEIREYIIDWLRSCGHTPQNDINAIIQKARKEKTPLKNIDVYINRTDIQRIRDVSTSNPVKKLALALLCYAKVYADKYNRFSISITALSDWCGITRQHISTRYLPELIKTGYVSKDANNGNGASWYDKKRQTGARHAPIQLRINVPVHNSGQFMLEENDFDALYQRTFCQ